MILAALDQTLASAGIAASIAGVIFTALRFGRDDTGKLIDQQHTIFEELEHSHDRVIAERDECARELRALREELESARSHIRELEKRAREAEARAETAIERLAQAIERRGTDAP